MCARARARTHVCAAPEKMCEVTSVSERERERAAATKGKTEDEIINTGESALDCSSRPIERVRERERHTEGGRETEREIKVAGQTVKVVGESWKVDRNLITISCLY